MGLSLDAQYFDIKFKDLITGAGDLGDGVNDPRSTVEFLVIPDPSLPITDPVNASFLAIVNQLAGVQTRGGESFDPAIISDVKFIRDTARTNVGFSQLTGIDFNMRYDWDMGNLGAWNIGVAGYYEVGEKRQANDFSEVEDRYFARHTGNRLQRARYRLGWTDGDWTITAIGRYVGHGSLNTRGSSSLPRCYYHSDFASTGAGSCYPGSPFYGPFENDVFPNYSPATVEFDLAFSYQTGLIPASEYLQNIRFDFTIINVLNKQVPFQIGLRGRGLRDGRAFDNAYNDQQRQVSISVTKAW